MMNEKFDLYEKVTETILAELEKGIIPWKKDWKGGEAMRARNFVTNRPYNGINAILLSILPYSCPFFATFRQIQEKGGIVKAGEKSHLVVYWNFSKVKDKETGEEKAIPFLKYYRVFNLEQTSIEYTLPKVDEKTFKPIESAEKIFTDYATRENIPIIYGGERAFYSSASDNIHLPRKEVFETSEGFYATAFHEEAHSTGHKSRLNREEINKIAAFGDCEYSKEELIAELGASFLCANCGIDNSNIVKNSVAYIGGWIKALRNDKRLIVMASGKAAKAANYILGDNNVEE
jgi:antirestriction protein ArdC